MVYDQNDLNNVHCCTSTDKRCMLSTKNINGLPYALNCCNDFPRRRCGCLNKSSVICLLYKVYFKVIVVLLMYVTHCITVSEMYNVVIQMLTIVGNIVT